MPDGLLALGGSRAAIRESDGARHGTFFLDVMREFQAPDFLENSGGKCGFSVSEKLAFQQTRGDRRAIQLEESALAERGLRSMRSLALSFAISRILCRCAVLELER